MSLNVCLAGATGWAGSELARGLAAAEGLKLVSAVSRKHAGGTLAQALGDARLDAPVFATAAEALARPVDVFMEYTRPDSAKANILAALEHGAHVVVGTSGLTDDDYARIDEVARAKGRAVLACGNFALTMVLLQKFAEQAAKYILAGKSSTTPTKASPMRQAARCANWPGAWARCASRNSACRLRKPMACAKRAAARWAARRCTRCACRASCSVPK
jgi:hypothetical protein